MKILFIFIDKVHDSNLQALISNYEKRLGYYCVVEIRTIIVPKNVRKKSIEEQKSEEERLILDHLKNSDFVILLDEQGKEMTSVEFSQWLGNISGYSKRVVFVVGGPYGLSESIKQVFPNKISLSKMTFSHEMVRLVLFEQLYRSFTILKGQKYHH